MLSIEMLPANEGDALWIEYGEPANPHRILVDCGSKEAYRQVVARLSSEPAAPLELFVLTHIDGDHIAGAVPLFSDKRVTPDLVGDVWFNGREMLDDKLGVRHAEFFTAELARRGFRWNETSDGKALAVADGQLGAAIELRGGLRLTLLSPGRAQLDDLRTHWNTELDAILKGKTLDELLAHPPAAYRSDVLGERSVAALASRPYEPDRSPPNGSSIAFLAELRDDHDGGREKAVLFAGDAHSEVLEASIEKLLVDRKTERLRLDAYKVSHHGSRANNSPRLLELLRCKHFLFSSNGSRHGHPDAETIARILVSQNGPLDLYFNYSTDANRRWRSHSLARKHRYTAHYPAAGTSGLEVTL